jgi:valyl-tRNA synthetase
MNVPPSKKAKVIIITAHPLNYQEGAHFITRLAYASEVTVNTETPQDLTGMVTVVTHEANVYMPLNELVDLDKERQRISKELEKARENLMRLESKLSNTAFTSRAPEAVVNAEREKAEKARALIAKLEESASAMEF